MSIYTQRNRGTVVAGCEVALAKAVPSCLASAVRGCLPIVCVLTFGAGIASFADAAIAETPSGYGEALAYDLQSHDALIAARRDGRMTAARALQQLRQWMAAPLDSPQRRRVASDAIVIAVADGRFTDAVELGHQMPAAELSDYALEPLAVAARRMGDLAQQGDTIKVWKVRQPESRVPRVHEAFWRLAENDTMGAQAIYRALAQPAPSAVSDRVALLDLQAALARALGEPYLALAAYQNIIKLQPERYDAVREASFLLAEQGGASAAFDDALAFQRAHPGALSALALSTLEHQALAQRLRWAVKARDQRVGSARVVEIDRVLADQISAQERLDAGAAQTTPQDADNWRILRARLQSDRMLALLERGRPADTISQYETLLASGAELPAYALGVVARAMAQVRRSADAVPLFEKALADLPVSDDLTFGLVYAYLDTGRFDDAEALMRRMEDDTPATMRLAPEAGRPNDQYSSVVGMDSLLQLYGDRPKIAQPRFAALTGEAPLNAGFVSGAALTERFREHPEAAVARFEALATNHPDNLSARIGHIEALLNAGEFREARQRAEAVEADASDTNQVREMTRKRRSLVGAQLEIGAEGSRGGTALAGREWRADSRLSSGLIDDAWRVFYAQTLGRGDTFEGSARLARAGLGLSWQQGRWLAEGVLQHANAGPYRNSVAGRVAYRASDAWRLSASYDGDSKDLPWKARAVPTGAQSIGARDFGASVTYLRDESRRFDLQWRRLDFSDGNLRNSFDIGWRERWISTPSFQFETRLGADTSRNRLQDVRYFSPSRDASVTLAVRGQWLTWKRDNQQFIQVVEIAGGSYHQADYGRGPLWSLRYEHIWALGQKLRLRYGVSLGSHPYDGVSERQHGVFLNLSMPLQ
ncbi:poly-beta-1,6 N-acetyl-D-glucosamine export porin PgaA [Ottowia thiooxydans]|uniref:poly-beta-1,6 N-acetyl-D-glucosamine export porin PgaA n=1 Tax=Ottowia thiooxydans TaxID=219182 RepID=UPI001B7FB26F|nr:poly-beta-1,6 N-acetyl-D-glucosamine export porin PgaA [Ottowia thiooxydans]